MNAGLDQRAPDGYVLIGRNQDVSAPSRSAASISASFE